MELKAAIEIVNAHGIEMLDHPEAGIELVAVGSKQGSLVQATDFCVTAFVKEKLPIDRLHKHGTFSFSETFSHVTGVKNRRDADLDVVVCGSGFSPYGGLSVPRIQRGRHGGPVPTCDPQKWFNSLRCGIGIANANGYPDHLTAGTAGFYVRVRGSHKLYLVSNNHVLARSNQAVLGECIVQPGTLDLSERELRTIGNQSDLERALGIAQLKAFASLNFRTPQNLPLNRVDAAIAELLDTESSGRLHGDLDRLTYSGGITGVAGSATEDRPVRVHKVGRTTGFTEGEVTHINGTASIPYDGGEAYFTEQLVIHPTSDNVGRFSKPGDSGSAVLDERNRLVGLVFAGSQDSTLANPIGLVLEALEAELAESLEVVYAAKSP